jgi:hypothetical protein
MPIGIGCFGLGTGYFVRGGQAFFDVPKPTSEVNRTMGMWGFWMPGFMQFITGVYLVVGLSGFNVYGSAPPLYMAALAFTAYGIPWFAMPHRRFIGSSDQPDAWMAIAFALFSILGVIVFAGAHDGPVAILFMGLTLIYPTEIPGRFSGPAGLARLTRLWQLLTGIWLMVLAYATALNLSLGAHGWL